MNILSVKARPALTAMFQGSNGTENFVADLLPLRLLAPFLALVTVSASICAQTPPSPDFAPPTVDMVDAVGVSMNSGWPNITIAPVAIGAKGDEFRFSESFSGSITNGSEFRTSALIGTVYGSKIGSIYGTGFMVVNVFGKAEIMQPTGDGVHWSSKSQQGGTLSITSAGQVFTYQYVDKNGSIYDFTLGGDPNVCADRTVVNSNGIFEISAYDARCALLSRVTYPDGRTLDIGFPTADPTDSTHYVQKFTRSDGFQLIAEYRVSVSGGSHVDPENVPEPFRVTAYNMAFDYCDLAAVSCSFTKSWPYATYTWSGQEINFGDRTSLTVQDAAGGQTRYTEQLEQGYNRSPITNIPYSYSMVVGVKPPSSLTDDTVTYTYQNQAFCFTYRSGINSETTDCSTYQRDVLVKTATNAVGTWTYGYTHDAPQAPTGSRAPGLYTTTVTRPDGFTMTGQYNSLTGYIQYVNGSHGNVVYLTDYLNVPNSITSSTDWEGRQFTYSFDGRGNLQSRRQPGPSGATGVLYQASFPSTCALPTSCNKPTWTQDPNTNETDYVYDPVHGGVVTETSPAVPDVNGNLIRPQKRYTYVQRTPWLKNSTSGYSAGKPIWKLNSVSYCRTGSPAASGVGCALANDEVLMTYDYGQDAGPNNLLVRGVVVAADGASHRTCYAYDIYGNKISETSANAGLSSCP